MLSLEQINRFAVQWQTTPLNVGREYVQHLFLSYLYQSPESDALAFKGGTALRLIFQSPRFSEDLDFSGHLKPFHLKELLRRTLQSVIREAVPLQEEESKPTSGGYLALYHCDLHGMDIRIELNISLREKTTAEPVLVATPLVPAYQCMVLTRKKMVQEKMEALLFRRKPRDFFDLYFLIRNRLGLEAVLPLKSRLLKEVTALDPKYLHRELKVFLPVSHQRVAAQLPQLLAAELNRL